MKNRQQYIAISVIWFKAFSDCREAQASNPGLFPSIVQSFYDSLLDLGKDKMAIKSIVEKYVNEEWQPVVDKEILVKLKNAWSETENKKDQIKRDVTNSHIKKIYTKIIQTIQDSGIGWPTDDEYQTFMITQE